METPPRFDIAEIIKDYAKRHLFQVFLYVICSFAPPIVEVVLPYYYGQIIQKISSGDTNLTDDLWKVAGLWVLAQLLYAAADYIDRTFIPGLTGYVRSELLKCVLYSYQEAYEDPEIGELVTRLVKLPQLIRDAVGQFRQFVLPSIYNIVFASLYFFYVDMRLGAVSFIGLGIIGAVMTSFIKKCIHKSAHMDSLHHSLNESIEDALENMINIFSSGGIQEEMGRFRDKAQLYQESCSDTIDCTAQFKVKFNLLYFAFFASVNGYAYYLLSKSEMELSSLSSTLIVSLYLISTLANIAGELREFVFNYGALKQNQDYLFQLRDSLPVYSPDKPRENFSGLGEGIELKGVTLHPSMNNSNLKIRKGSQVVITGEIGSGKSTLIKLLLKYLQPTSGKVMIDGMDVSQTESRKIRDLISYVPQHPKLFDRTLRENLCYGFPKSQHPLVIEKSQKIFEMLGFGNTFDLDRMAGKGGSKISGGQRQTLVLVREILRGRPYLFLDEPTSSLDANSKKRILELISTAMIDPSRTTIVVTHDPDVLTLFKQVIQFPI